MRKSLIIVDDFLNDPHALRDIALKQEYPTEKGSRNYPGRNSRYSQIINGFDQKIREIIGEPIVPELTASHAKFRLALEGDEGKDGVHIDPVNWTVILYLTLPEHCKGGTHLFRHIETNSDHAPFNEQQMLDMGYSDQDVFMKNVIDKNTNDRSKWEELTTIPMRFNRLVILKPQQYHDAGISFGDCPENGRLVYICTYN
ncbi:DUF6445 family protein [Kordiimonas aquimaris]|uniref:DUF6445 family protein n=1 Tax=Kordiimonas aquimaris TaxID=707591 RepID=UPI0021CFFA85|nr:DUF6445 family protein [Kordiimonas aquimaris]